MDEARGQVRGEIEALYAELSRPKPSTLFLKASLLKLLVLLSRAWARTGGYTGSLTFRKEVWAVLDAVETALTRGKGASLASLSGTLGLSPDHLSRLFKEATGFSVKPYFQHRRVQRACAMLLNAEMSVTEVAYALGYADAAHMSKLFKKHMGLSPNAYRSKFSV